jgi:hypothetical protein
MARQPYPLQALRELRERRAEASAEALARQVARSATFAAALGERERARREHAERLALVLEQERHRLAAGPVSGAELRRASDFEQADRAALAVTVAAEAEARAALAREQAEEQRLCAELAQAEAEAKLVRDHEASFHEKQVDAALRAEEEAALERWNALHR